jgi:sensor histidine kinase YesM
MFYISYFNIPEVAIIVLAYLLFTTFVFLMWQYAKLLIVKEEKTRTELSALKSQINPHFLFNNLNTIYSMAERNDKHTSRVVLQLSDFLRYVLYDTTADFIALEKEVEIITTYINLQKERINAELTKIEFITEGNFEGQVISPLLLLPLVENCFKYSKAKTKGFIHIKLLFDGRQLSFSTRNNIAVIDKPNGNRQNGLGIINVLKRLELVYQGKYTFVHGEADGVYNLEMKLKLTQTAAK